MKGRLTGAASIPALQTGIPLHTFKWHVHILWITPLVLIASWTIGQLRMGQKGRDHSHSLWGSERWSLPSLRHSFPLVFKKKKRQNTPLNTSGRNAYFTWAESKNCRPKVPLWPHLLLSNKINYNISPCLSHGKLNTYIYRPSTVSWETANRFASPLRSPLFLSIIDPLHLYAILRLKIKCF